MTTPILQQDETVCAVVVTYNRKDLLRKCLQALLAQTHAVSRILVVNNASTDETVAMVATEFSPALFPQIGLLTLPSNIGGAGGFHHGIKKAHSDGAEWIWLLDDDTIAEPTALAELFAARSRFDPDDAPDLIASKVLWTDGSLHWMNAAWRRQDDPVGAYIAAERATLPLRGATFVSLLIRRRYVDEFGLPLADYFIWGDDVEYTARILRRNRGVLAPQSVVVHETPINHTAMTAVPAKFYYFVRNELWMTARSSALTGNERVKRLWSVVYHAGHYLKSRGFEWLTIRWIARGIWDAVTTRPRY